MSNHEPQPPENGPAPDEPQVASLVDTIPCALYAYVRWPDGRSRFVCAGGSTIRTSEPRRTPPSTA